MNPSVQQHDEAMLLAEDADVLRRQGNHSAARERFAQALQLERAVAMAEATEPSRSILLRSAAWLALEAEDPREAERLGALGLSGLDVPERVAGELRAVMEEARLRLHALIPPPSAVSSISVHFEGPGVGYGGASPEDVVRRIDALRKIVERTAERVQNRPFRKKGSPPEDIRVQLDPRIQLQAASVVVGITLGGQQQNLWDQNASLIENIRACVAAASQEDSVDLARLIPERTYRDNFRALVGALQPDGRRVTAVDLIAAAKGQALPSVRLAERAMNGSVLRVLPPGTEGQFVVGEIRAADQTGGRNTIKLTNEDAPDGITVHVSEALLEDIVRPYFGKRVRVHLSQKKRRRELLAVEEVR